MNLQQIQHEIGGKLAKKMADIEDSAVSTYIRAQIAYLERKGEDLTEYELVRMDGGYGLDDTEEMRDGVKLKVNVIYKLRKMKAAPIAPPALRDCGLTMPQCMRRGVCEGHE